MNTQSSPVSFDFESTVAIRALTLNGEPWFIAMDVCKALQLANPSMALKALDDDERSKFNLGRQGNANIISESGLYTLILRCRDAVTPGTTPHRFRKWVTSDVLPQIRKTGKYAYPEAETLSDLVNTANTSMNVRDARRSKKETDKKAAERIAEKCVPVILREMRDYQYHYSNCDIGPAEVIPAFLSDGRNELQLHALLRELGNNNHEVSGAFRELEVMRHCFLEMRQSISDMQTHAQYMLQKVKNH